MNRQSSSPKCWEWGMSLNAAIELADIKAAGLDCIEIVLNGKRFYKDFSEAKQYYQSAVEKAQKLDLRVASLHLPYGKKWDVSLRKPGLRNDIIHLHYELLKLAAEWEIPCAVIHPSYEPISGKDRPERLAICRESLKWLSQAANSLGLRLAAECLPRTCLGNTSDEMIELLRDNEYLGVCCDVNHLFQESPEAFIRKIGEHIVTLHISDNDGIDERHWMPGEGVIHWESVIGALSEVGYEGPFMLEVVKPNPGNIAECLQRLFQV